MAKENLSSEGAKYVTHELDQMDNGGAIQAALQQKTGRWWYVDTVAMWW